ncbi:LOW QUALITY PROTEIN: microsomal triglyceride transfer protein large subunit [Drosophila eugracilis]|uniref:LOW QUALITY PROTEIN: microsomal triglyceride transfer protein large subunit n=1 Tax=Drosophila eugracilis TaxID=29029 RepID=UPI001BDAD363|nr:LOW QUALITY PROTEIN: microsomal triglyceride transfer protein large subunit [Drosophila eugracilis]
MESLQKSYVKSLLLLAFIFGFIDQGRTSLIPPNSQQIYKLQNQVTLEELGRDSSAKETSYKFQTDLKINSVWSQDEDQLLEVFISNSQVDASGKVRSITNIPDRPFYIGLVKGQPEKVIAHSGRDQSVLNLKRGIASLLQLRLDGSQEEELDVSGVCRVSYNVKSSTKVEKIKRDCSLWDLRVNYHPEEALGIKQEAQETISYELSSEGNLLKAESLEDHLLNLAAKPDVGSLVKSTLVLQHISQGSEEVKQLDVGSLEEAIESLLEWYRVFRLESDVDGMISEIKEQTLEEQLKASVEALQSADVGKSSLALAYVKLIPLARVTRQDQFEDILKEHSELLPQLVDLLGAVQTFDAHNATFGFLYKDEGLTNEELDLLEKYLQSLAVATHPDRKIVEHLRGFLDLQSIKKQLKLKETIIQTLATLTRQSGFDADDLLLQKVRSYFLKGIASKKPTLYIRALQNLQDTSTITPLLEQAQNGDKPNLSVVALQALKAFPPGSFTPSHRKQFESIFYQRKQRFDSSVRTLALDIILSLRPSAEQLGYLLDYLASNDRQFEIKTYVLQKLRMLSEKCRRFRTLFETELAKRKQVNNYNVLGQKGLTTVLSRQLSLAPAFNESLVSTQEVYQGILKRGSVEFLLHAGRSQVSNFKLGIYTAGLGSLVGDGDSGDGNDNIPADDELESEETVTAGMEISVQGAQLRPLIFFSGQTELMGHVWGGTASDSTPAYQATTLAQDNEHYIILASGATLHWQVLGARSVDLNGKVGFSLWNRNAQTEIQQNTGSAVLGHLAVGFTYAKLVQDFSLTHEPKLSLNADLDFYSGIKLCMQLQRPEQILKQTNVRSVFLQSVDRPYAKHVRSTLSHTTAGCTFALNQKNNEMCNMLLSDQ